MGNQRNEIEKAGLGNQRNEIERRLAWATSVMRLREGWLGQPA